MKGDKLDAEAFVNRQVATLEAELRRLGALEPDIQRCRTLADLVALKRRTLDECMGPPKGR